MQFGHLPLALSIATYDWNPRTILLVLGMHFLPNADSLAVKAGFAEEEFHCSITHSFFFALVASAMVSLFSFHYAIFGLVAVLAHYAADLGSTVGLPLLWPFSKRKVTLALWQHTGYWGKEMYTGYYRQPMAWVMEGGVTAFLIYRLFQIYG